LECFDGEGEAFLSQIITGDKTWVHHFEPETKRQSMEWHHLQLPRKKKFKTAPSAGKVMVTVFWDCDGVILVDVVPRGATINSEVYINTLNKLTSSRNVSGEFGLARIQQKCCSSMTMHALTQTSEPKNTSKWVG
jgi:hypothetical protein